MWIVLIVLIQLWTPCENIPNKGQEVLSVAGTTGQLICHIENLSDVSMVLWFKDNSGIPIYSYDTRAPGSPRHLPIKSELGLRLYFRVQTKSSSTRSPALFIKNLQKSDSGLYRCRIDYKSTPTSNSVIHLYVIQPPTHLEIRDHTFLADQRFVPSNMNNSVTSDISYMGPYIEGQNVTVVCAAYGGMPSPEVIWYVGNGNLLDSSFESIGGSNYVTNELIIVRLERNHSHDLYTCQASNNNETKPISHRVNFDVYSTVKHIDVEIPDQMTAGVQYDLLCRALGAYPSVRMEFWKMEERIGPKYQIKSDSEEIIQHRITFKPDAKDDESIVTCRAENPWISNSFMETGKKLHVTYVPIVILKFGTTKVSNFTEGESLLLECHVNANPPIRSISWFHQGKKLTENLTKGIKLNGMTLLLLHLTHSFNGKYTCEVTNEIGTGVSNSLPVFLNAAPRCNSSKEQVIPLMIGDSINLACNVIAWPPAVTIYWTFNRSNINDIIKVSNLSNTEKQEIEENARSVNGKMLLDKRKTSFGTVASCDLSKRSLLNKLETNNCESDGSNLSDQTDYDYMTYSVLTVNDYGIVGCWAQNSVGQQKIPCLFKIVSQCNGDIFDETVSSQMGKTNGTNMTESSKDEESWKWFSENKEGGILFPKLHGTYNIILMGVLIFITIFCLTGFTLWFFMVHDRQRQRTSTIIGTRISDVSPAIPLSSTPITTSVQFNSDSEV